MNTFKIIQWRYLTELQIVVGIVNDEPIFEKQIWQADDIEEVFILHDCDGFVDMEFGDGSSVYHVDKSLFREVEQ